MSLRFEKLERKHFEEYQSWFNQPNLNEAMSFPDENWFQYLQGSDVKGIAVLDDENQFVAELQIDRDPDGDGYVALTVKPELQNQGIGSQTLKKLLEGHELEGLHRVVAYASTQNEASVKLLEKCGFRDSGQEDENGFREFIYDLESVSELMSF